MDDEKVERLETLSAEVLALQSVVAHILDELWIAHPDLRKAIALGFDNAASDMESIAIQLGKAAGSRELVKALAVIESLRAATLGDHDKPRHGV